MKRCGGLALFIVIGALGVMSILAMGFITLAQLERKASERRVNATKALLLARSGIEDALARLSAGQDPSFLQNRFGGEDADLSGGPLSPTEASQEIFRPGLTDVETCPVGHALRPSFPALMGTSPLSAPLDARQRGYSGRLAAPSSGARCLYALKVEDESGKINVNGGVLGGPLTAGWNGQLLRILNLLGSQPEVGIPGLGTAVLTVRPASGYRSIVQLQGLVGTAKDLSPFLTARSWVDAKVIRPNVVVASPTSWRSMSDLKLSRPALKLEEGGRPPVNLNSASRPVLMALVQDLGGYYFKPHQATVSAPAFYVLSPPTATSVVEQIQTRRRTTPFRDWGDFTAFADSLVPTAISGMNADSRGVRNLCGADLLKANFDPNSMLNKDLPDQLMYRWIDKSDLTVWSTEGCFSPTGVFRVSSLGRITDANGRLLAAAEASTNVQAFHLLRQTTQRDFVSGRTLTPPAGEPRYLSLASPMTDPALQGYGATASAAWWGGTARSEGLAVMTYPCPITALPGNAADFDGSIGLATLEMTAVNPTAGTFMFLHHFDDAWDAEAIPGSPASRRAIGALGPDSRLQTDLSANTWPDPALGAPANEPNTFRPDGLHQQWLRSPCYQARGNIPGTQPADLYPSTHGAVGAWIKPLYGAGISYDVSFTCVRKSGAYTQALSMGLDIYNIWSTVFCGVVAETWTTAQDTGCERQAGYNRGWSQPLLPGARWQFHACAWDLDVSDLNRNVMYLLRDLRGGLQPQSRNPPYPNLSVALSTDLVPDNTVYFVLGGHPDSEHAGSQENDSGKGLHATVLDEFAICDFGDADAMLPTAFNGAVTWANSRWRGGRYYKEGDGSFTSAALFPSGGRRMRLLQAVWTQYLPKESRKEIVHIAGLVTPAVQGQGRQIDPNLNAPSPNDPRLELELLDASGTAVLQPIGQRVPIDRILDAFRYRVHFKVRPMDVPNQPVLETPVLDDITFTWQAATGPRILGWGE